MTIGRHIRSSIVRWGVLVPGPVEFYILSSPKRTCWLDFFSRRILYDFGMGPSSPFLFVWGEVTGRPSVFFLPQMCKSKSKIEFFFRFSILSNSKVARWCPRFPEICHHLSKSKNKIEVLILLFYPDTVTKYPPNRSIPLTFVWPWWATKKTIDSCQFVKFECFVTISFSFSLFLVLSFVNMSNVPSPSSPTLPLTDGFDNEFKCENVKGKH